MLLFDLKVSYLINILIQHFLFASGEVSHYRRCWIRTRDRCTVSSAGFSIFVYWKFAVHGLHNLRPCTGFLFLVNSRIYYGLYTVSFFTYKWTAHFRWSFLATGILQRICCNSDVRVHSVYCERILNSAFFYLIFLFNLDKWLELRPRVHSV